MDEYNGETVRLGSRLARLPDERDLKGMRPIAAKYAAVDAVMPRKNDIITITGIDGEWLVCQSDRGPYFDCRTCQLTQVTGDTELVCGSQMTLHIAYDETVRKTDFREAANNKQVDRQHVTIVGQAKQVTIIERLSPPQETGLLSEK